MEMDRPPTCKCTWVEDEKQEIYLEWPKWPTLRAKYPYTFPYN